MEDQLNVNRGSVLAELSAPEKRPEPISQDILSAINERIKPLSPVSETEVYVRSMYIVSDQINSYGGRFPADEFPRLVELLVDSPVLIGHRKDSLPIGRTFHAVPVNRGGQLWIKSSFYWLRTGDEAERLRENIDGGIYKECSIGFAFLVPECSICGEDIRQCRHLPLETYIINGQEHRCHFYYRQIQKVLETSLVYRGATPDTSISKDLTIKKSVDDRYETPEPLHNLDGLTEHASYVLVPSYEGIGLSFRLHEGKIVAWRKDGRRIDLGMFGRLKAADDAGNSIWQARVVGLRGKERCSRADLEKYLQNETGPVSRLSLFIYPSASGAQVIATGSMRHRVQPIRHRRVSRSEIVSAARMLTTKQGVEILCQSERQGEIRAFLYCPNESVHSTMENSKGVSFNVVEDHALLRVGGDRGGQQYIIRDFNVLSFTQGRRFIADRVEPEQELESKASTRLLDGAATKVRSVGGAVLIETSDRQLGTVVLRPAVLHTKKRFLCYCLPTAAQPSGRSCHAV